MYLMLVLTPMSFSNETIALPENGKVCVACHGLTGNSHEDSWPKIAGLHKNYIEKQLLDFQLNRRHNEEMKGILQHNYTHDDMLTLAQYFSRQDMSASPLIDGDKKENSLINMTLGKEIYEGKRIEYGIPACAACHGKDGEGDANGKFPRLKGQHQRYLVKQMVLFRSKERANDSPPMMRNISMMMDDEDIESVAAYIAQMK